MENAMSQKRVVLITVILVLCVVLVQCTAKESEKEHTTPVVVVKEVVPYITPTPTPFCTDLPPGKRVEVQVIPPDQIHIVLEGFRKEEDPHIIVEGIGKVHGQYEVIAARDIYNMQIGANVFYELTIALPSTQEPVEWWQLRVTFPGGDYCKRLEFPELRR